MTAKIVTDLRALRAGMQAEIAKANTSELQIKNCIHVSFVRQETDYATIKPFVHFNFNHDKTGTDTEIII